MTISTPLSPRGMRRHNLELVLRTVADGGGASRAQIAAATGLNKTTVSSLVGDLIERGLLRESGVVHRGGVGRPGATIDLDGDTFVALGLEIGVDYLAFAAIDLLGRVRDEGFVQRQIRGVPETETLGALGLLVGQALERLRSGGLTPLGATLGLPGLVDTARGELLFAPNLGWQEVAVAELLRSALDEPDLHIRVENEANLGALAERWEGAGRTLDDFLYVSGYIGVGAGLVLGGRLHRGTSGFGGEFGHMTLVADGPACACGSRGCVETFVGLNALLEHVGYSWADVRSTAPSTPIGPLPELAAAAAAGEARVLDAFERVGTLLGQALASSINLLGFATVVLGSYFAPLHEWLSEWIEREIRRRVLFSRWAPVRVLKSQVTGGAAVRGAAALSVQELFADPTSVTPPAA